MLGVLGASAVEPVQAGPDADGDGVVTPEGFQGSRLTGACANDPDGDGALSLEEFRPMLPARVPRMMQGRAFGRIDAEGDGYVVPRELEASPARVFEATDADGDGRLTRAEGGSGAAARTVTGAGASAFRHGERASDEDPPDVRSQFPLQGVMTFISLRA
mgnify:FL=1